ncbi:hypothetical protein Q9189_004946 [Teloschistes chrysophthalmus]
MIATEVHSLVILDDSTNLYRCSVMAQGPTFFILKSLLPLPASEADLLLGRIVKNFEAPWTVSAPKDVSKLTEGFPEGGNKDFKLEKQTSKNVSLKMRLQGLLGINLIDTIVTASQSEASEASLEGDIPIAQLATGTPLAVVTTGLIHRERLRLKDKAPQMPNERQLAGETDSADEASDDDDSGHEIVGSKKEQQRRNAEMDIAKQMETLPINPNEWDELYDSFTDN